MRFLLAAIAVFALLLWAGAIAGICAGAPTGFMCVVLAAATTASVVAGIWAIALHLHDADRRLLLLALADVTRPPAPALRTTRPLRLAQ